MRVAEQLASHLARTGRAIEWRAVWVRTGGTALAALTAATATALGLLTLRAPAEAGIALVALFALWTLETAGLPSPLRALCPQRATQDALALDPKSRSGPAVSLLLVRADLHAIKPKRLAWVMGHISMIVWALMVLTLAAAAARALEVNEQVAGAVQLFPALLSLGILAAVVLSRSDKLEAPSDDWTGIDQAISAIAALDCRDTPTRRFHVVVVGASDLNGTSRVLKADRAATEACRCWEFGSGEAVLAALGDVD
jgi:hypothetical protein